VTAEQFAELQNQLSELNQLLAWHRLVAILAFVLLIVLVAVLVGFLFRALLRRVTPTQGRGALTQEGRGLLDYGNLLIVSLGLVLGLIGFLVILLSIVGGLDTDQALGFLTAFFGVITGLVGTFFGIKASSDAASAAGDTAIPLTVTSVTPSRDATDVSGDTNISATFSKAVSPASISESTFRVVSFPAGGAVPGRFAFEQDNITVIFTPDAKPLTAGGIYQATITTDVTDQAGNKLVQDYMWQFTIAP
jgi:hypothetical protein